MEVDRVVSELKQGIHGHNDYANALSPVPPPPIMIDEEHALPTGGMDETTRLLDDGRGASQQQQQQEKGTSRPWLIHLAINVSFIANVALFIAKFLLALYSGSMAILASAFESFLDLLSNGIIFITVRMMRNQDWYRYPVGKVISGIWALCVNGQGLTNSICRLVWNHLGSSYFQSSSPPRFLKCSLHPLNV